MAEPHLIYVPLESATPEGELAALAAVYRFVLENYEREKAAEHCRGEETV